MLITDYEAVEAIIQNILSPQGIVEKLKNCGKEASFHLIKVDTLGETSLLFSTFSSIATSFKTYSISANIKNGSRTGFLY